MDSTVYFAWCIDSIIWLRHPDLGTLTVDGDEKSWNPRDSLGILTATTTRNPGIQRQFRLPDGDDDEKSWNSGTVLETQVRGPLESEVWGKIASSGKSSSSSIITASRRTSRTGRLSLECEWFYQTIDVSQNCKDEFSLSGYRRRSELRRQWYLRNGAFQWATATWYVGSTNRYWRDDIYWWCWRAWVETVAPNSQFIENVSGIDPTRNFEVQVGIRVVVSSMLGLKGPLVYFYQNDLKESFERKIKDWIYPKRRRDQGWGRPHPYPLCPGFIYERVVSQTS